MRDAHLRESLRPLFQPTHVAVIGASSTPDKHGNALMALQSLVLSSNGLIRSIDVNPFLVHDTGCVAVDALIVPAADK